MGRIYVAAFSGISVAAAQDLFELNTAAAHPIIIRAVKITQTSDAGDAEAEMLDVSLVRRSGGFSAGSGGTSLTPAPLGDYGAASVACDRNNTSGASGGTSETLDAEGSHIAGGYRWVRSGPRGGIYVADTELLTVTLNGAPADSLDVCGAVEFEEL